MTWENFGFQYPYLLALLALLPVYSLLVGRAGKVSALRFSSADLARAAGGARIPVTELAPEVLVALLERG